MGVVAYLSDPSPTSLHVYAIAIEYLHCYFVEVPTWVLQDNRGPTWVLKDNRGATMLLLYKYPVTFAIVNHIARHSHLAVI